MRDKGKQILGIVAIIVVISAIGTLTFSVILNLETQNYVSTKRIPGIVEGTAQMIDTQSYFTKHTIASAKTTIELHCNDSNYIQMKIGYKEATNSLMNAQNPIKEVEIWSGGNKFSSKSIDFSTSRNEIKTEWNLFEIGFTESDYVKADERIWYLKIADTRTGPFGYERNITIEENGEVIILPDFEPNVNYIKKFQLTFNDLGFETLLYPFFDGSKEVIIPIRGVNHELTKESFYRFYPSTEMKNEWSTSQPYGSSNNRWAIVFGTFEYDSIWFNNLYYTPMECRAFIQGVEKAGAPSEFDAGLLDYGWRVAYCMDGSTQQTDMATTSETDESYLKQMFNAVDSVQGSSSCCVVFVAGHGYSYYGNHLTITGNSACLGLGWINVMRLSDYEEKVEALTDDGTHVLMWICACHGNGLNEFMGADSHNRLECWSYQPEHAIDPAMGEVSHIPTDTYEDFCWLFDEVLGYIEGRSEAAIFFLGAAEGINVVSVSAVGPDMKDFYDGLVGDNTMYIQKTWGTYSFYINFG